jgi:hypothetical protein
MKTEVKAGFQQGVWHDEWHSAYLYCRRFDEDYDPSHKDWAWRVVVSHAWRDNPTTLYG